MQDQAARMGANAVIGGDLDYEKQLVAAAAC